MSSKRVSSHAFYPLINYHIESYKIFRNSENEIERKEKSRPIAYAAHIDSHIYAYYACMLSEYYESKIQDFNLGSNVLAFRPLGKSNIDFADNAFEDIKKRVSCSAVALDVSGFFDKLDHNVLKEAWAQVLGKSALPSDHYNVFKSLTKFSMVDRALLYQAFNISIHNPKHGRYQVCTIEDFRKVVRGNKLIQVNLQGFGIPQGTPISALLSNIYMLEFDCLVKEVVEEQGGSYYRYCDDMLFIVPTEFKRQIVSYVQEKISTLKLEINTSKTEIRDFWEKNGQLTCNKPLQYLGFTFDGQRKLIRSAALARFSKRMKRGVWLAKATQIKKNSIKASVGQAPTALYKQKLYDRYSHLGTRNFIRYGHRAANKMQSNAIRKQLKPLWKRLKKEIHKQ